MKKKTQLVLERTPVLKDSYETEIEYVCPVRGLVKQKVKVKRYQGCEPALVEDILASTNLADQLDLKYSGLLLEDTSVEDDSENV